MKFCIISAILAAGTFASADPPAIPVLTPRPAPRPLNVSSWLGLRVAKPDETITAHLPAIPPGVGFVVRSIDPGGPAQAAGILELDLVWKFGDQLLINEAQLATLLRLSKPSEEVKLSLFRAGQPLVVKLKLGEAPIMSKPVLGELVESAIMPGACVGPMRVVNIAEKSASYTADDGSATVRRDGDLLQITITGLKQEAIYDGKLAKGENFDTVPEGWRRRVQVLSRSLDHALDGNSYQRQPRPRVVPAAASNP